MKCSFPTHAQNSAVAGWDDGEIGNDQTLRYVCAGCRNSAQTNKEDIYARAKAALGVNKTYLLIPAPTAAQAVAQVGVLTRQVNTLIRLILNDFEDTT